MLLDSNHALRWRFRKARILFNLFISVDPDIHEALRNDRPLYDTQCQNNYGKDFTRQDDFGDPLSETSSRDDQLSEGSSSSAENIYVLEPPGASLVFPRVTSESAADSDAPRLLRSTRHRKYRSVSDAVVGAAGAQVQSVPQLRRTKRCISWPMTDGALKALAHTPQASTQFDENLLIDINVLDSNDSSYATASTLLTHGEQSSGYSQYVTARTSFDCTLDSIDEDSVVHFFNPSHGPVNNALQPPCETDDLPRSGYEQYITAHSYASTSVLATSQRFTYRLNTPRLPIPSLMLTMPTPNIPSSPDFVVQSPITMPKYLTASSSTPGTTSGQFSSNHTLGVPSLPRCDCCGLAEFEDGTQCAECDQQWLACKIWYQANDGGRRRYLTEPYIKPAESTARSRAILDVLGVPGGSPGPLGLGIEFETQTPRKRRFWRISRLLSSVPIPEKLTASLANKAQSECNNGTDATLLENLSKKASSGIGRLRTKFIALLDPVQDGDSHDSGGTDSLVARCTRSLHQLVPSILSFGPANDGLDDPVPLPGPVPHAESRFVEHLAAHFGGMIVRI